MPAPQKKGLEYFPFDAGFFRDKKIKLLRGEHGADGVEIYMRLLCKIYEDNGYYLRWDNTEDYELLAEETGYSIDKVRLIISTLFRRSLLDYILFERGNVLSSHGIQRRYFEAVKATKIKAAANGRHTTIDEDICLLTEEDFFELNKTYIWLKAAQKNGNSENNGSKSENNGSKSGNNSDKSENNPPKKIKLKKRKINKSKLRKGVPPAGAPGNNASPDFVISLILNDKTEYAVKSEQVKLWTELYPNVDVMQELRNMKGWCIANIKKRKTQGGIENFIINWLSKNQNKGFNPSGESGKPSQSTNQDHGTKGECPY